MDLIDSHVSTVFLLRADGAALMQHRDDRPGLRHAGMWVPPGGHRESGEDAKACAERELLEETDYRCNNLTFLHAFLDKQPGWEPYELTVFRARYDEEQQVCCHEGQALEFVSRENADALSVPAYLIDLWDMAVAAELACGHQFERTQGGEPD